MKCKKCNSSKIKSRTNYFFGKNSRSRIIFMCKKCGSTDVEANAPRYGGRRGRR